MVNFYSNSDRGYSLVLEVTQTGQNKGANQSTVRSRLLLRNTYTTFAQYTVTGSMVINGTTHSYNARPAMLSNNSTITLLDKTQTVTHDSNGAKTINVSASIRGSGGYSPGSLSTGTKSFRLTDIPRSSTVQISNAIIGSSATITINASDSSFTHNLRYGFGSLSGYIARGVKGSTTWAIPMDFANQLPNATSGGATIWCETYSGSTKISESRRDFVISVPESIKPSLSGFDVMETFSPVKALNLGANQFVQILSNPQVGFSGASGIFGSSITGYKAEIVGKSQSTNQNGGTLGTMPFDGQVTIRASVTDSRGRTSNPVDKTVTVLPYHPPVLNFTAVRKPQNKTNLIVTRNAKIAPLTVGGVQKNKMTLTFKTAPLGSTSFTTNYSNASGTYTSTSSLINLSADLSGTFATTSSFDVLGILEDAFTKTEFKVTVGTEGYVFSYDRYGMGVMKARERGALDVNGDAYVSGNIYADGKPIQQHQLTQHSGQALQASGDWNNYTQTGFYMGHSMANIPSGTHPWKFVQVMHHNANYVTQMAYDFSGSFLAYRVKYNGTWQEWKKLATIDDINAADFVKANHQNLINTGWKHVGNSFYYKRVGDVVYLKYDFTTVGTKRFVAGTLPSELVPSEMMFMQTSWTLDQYPITIQVGSDGKVEWINNKGYAYRYAGQISWAI
ncbi:DUF859 family phage minor structural protein [Streptococcus jiangjianxini]|uniref:DUF859 family phage minor structural protein n=1 Tax=Streptococcus jiangjianxini TaxID=3161189 RepID=UPI0032EE29E0